MPAKPPFTPPGSLPVPFTPMDATPITNSLTTINNFINALDLSLLPKEVLSVNLSPIFFITTVAPGSSDSTFSGGTEFYLSGFTTNVSVPFNNAKCILFTTLDLRASSDGFWVITNTVGGSPLKTSGDNYAPTIFNTQLKRGCVSFPAVSTDLGPAGVKTFQIRMSHTGSGFGTVYRVRCSMIGFIFN